MKPIIKGIMYGLLLWIAFDTILGITLLTVPDYVEPELAELSDYAREILEVE